VRALRELAHEVGRRVELYTPCPGLGIQHELGIGIGPPPQPTTAQRAPRRRARVALTLAASLVLGLPRRIALRRFFVELAADGAKQGLAPGLAFQGCLEGLLAGRVLSCRLLSCSVLSCSVLSCSLLTCRRSLGLLTLSLQQTFGLQTFGLQTLCLQTLGVNALRLAPRGLRSRSGVEPGRLQAQCVSACGRLAAFGLAAFGLTTRGLFVLGRHAGGFGASGSLALGHQARGLATRSLRTLCLEAARLGLCRLVGRQLRRVLLGLAFLARSVGARCLQGDGRIGWRRRHGRRRCRGHGLGHSGGCRQRGGDDLGLWYRRGCRRQRGQARDGRERSQRRR